jgi:hypothetical protein
MNIDEMREYIRHPTDIPIICSISNTPIDDQSRMHNVSNNGLCFTSRTKVTTGSNIDIKIPLNDTDIEVNGVVIWCYNMENHYEMGVKFSDEKTDLAVRMIGQLCHIEQYRNDVKANEGRELTSEEAGREWIEKFADTSPE